MAARSSPKSARRPRSASISSSAFRTTRTRSSIRSARIRSSTCSSAPHRRIRSSSSDARHAIAAAIAPLNSAAPDTSRQTRRWNIDGKRRRCRSSPARGTTANATGATSRTSSSRRRCIRANTTKPAASSVTAIRFRCGRATRSRRRRRPWRSSAATPATRSATGASAICATPVPI